MANKIREIVHSLIAFALVSGLGCSLWLWNDEQHGRLGGRFNVDYRIAFVIFIAAAMFLHKQLLLCIFARLTIAPRNVFEARPGRLTDPRPWLSSAVLNDARRICNTGFGVSTPMLLLFYLPAILSIFYLTLPLSHMETKLISKPMLVTTNQTCQQIGFTAYTAGPGKYNTFSTTGAFEATSISKQFRVGKPLESVRSEDYIIQTKENRIAIANKLIQSCDNNKTEATQVDLILSSYSCKSNTSSDETQKVHLTDCSSYWKFSSSGCQVSNDNGIVSNVTQTRMMENGRRILCFVSDQTLYVCSTSYYYGSGDVTWVNDATDGCRIANITNISTGRNYWDGDINKSLSELSLPLQNSFNDLTTPASLDELLTSRQEKEDFYGSVYAVSTAIRSITQAMRKTGADINRNCTVYRAQPVEEWQGYQPGPLKAVVLICSIISFVAVLVYSYSVLSDWVGVFWNHQAFPHGLQQVLNAMDDTASRPSNVMNEPRFESLSVDLHVVQQMQPEALACTWIGENTNGARPQELAAVPPMNSHHMPQPLAPQFAATAPGQQLQAGDANTFAGFRTSTEMRLPMR